MPAFISSALSWLHGPNGAILFGVLFGISESLAAIPAIKANSIYQLALKGLAWLKGLVSS